MAPSGDAAPGPKGTERRALLFAQGSRLLDTGPRGLLAQGPRLLDSGPRAHAHRPGDGARSRTRRDEPLTGLRIRGPQGRECITGRGPGLTQDLLTPRGVRLVGVHPLEVFPRNAAPHGSGVGGGSHQVRLSLPAQRQQRIESAVAHGQLKRRRPGRSQP